MTQAEAPYQETMVVHQPRSWITRYWFSRDHKVIAVQYAVTAIAVGLVALVLSGLMRIQIGFPGLLPFITPDIYYQAVTMHGMIMIIFLLTAFLLGAFGNFCIPLMLGARDMVFPFVNMLSYHIYLLSVLVLMASYFVPGGPTGAGWTLYPPQAILPGTPGVDWGIVTMLLSLIIFVVAFTMGGLNYITTILQARTRGMTLMRMPLTVWGLMMATVLGLLAFPALFVSAVMMLLDKLVGTSFFMPAVVSFGQQLEHSGGSPLLFQHLFWFFGHPEVYIVALPAFGVVSELISVHSRKNIFGYRMMVWALVAIAALSFVVWAHHMYVAGMHPYFGFFFATTTLVIAVPTAIKVYNWVLTLWKANIRLTVPMLFALAFILTFVVGGLSGLFLGNVIIDVPLSDTYFVVAHFHMVMGVAPILVIFGGIYHWYPKLTGRLLNNTLGQLHFWVTFLGTYAIYYPMHYLGFLGVPRRYYANGLESDFYPESAASLNEFITVADWWWVLCSSFLCTT
jgi:cytochrome c oxidase subunit 1